MGVMCSVKNFIKTFCKKKYPINLRIKSMPPERFGVYRKSLKECRKCCYKK